MPSGFRTIRTFVSRYAPSGKKIETRLAKTQAFLLAVASSITSFRTFLVDSLIIGFIVLILVFILPNFIGDRPENRITIDRFELPDTYVKNGFSQDNWTNDLRQRISEIQEIATTGHYRTQVGAAADRVDITLPSVGLSSNTIVTYLASVFDLKDKKNYWPVIAFW
jgi:hypothetical protein